MADRINLRLGRGDMNVFHTGDSQELASKWWPTGTSRSRHSPRTVPTKRSAKASQGHAFDRGSTLRWNFRPKGPN
jgi:hypothetical protein